MSRKVWEDWLPGVLSPNQVLTLSKEGYVDLGVKPSKQSLDPSSLDLHLTEEAWLLPKGSIKPFRRFFSQIRAAGLVEDLEPDPDGTFLLKAKHTYLFKLRESLQGLDGTSFYGQATAKSSVGRVDVLARLVVEGMNRYEAFEPDILGPGRVEMFVEVTPITFPVRVRPRETALNQLRLFYGKPTQAEMRGHELYGACLRGPGAANGTLSVDLTPVTLQGNQVAAFAAVLEKEYEPINLWNGASKADPVSYWRCYTADIHNRIAIEKNIFYILRSKEAIALPGGVAVYARAIDEEIGEMRIHYAGFVHPCFGRDRDDDKIGTPLIFEVRGHDVSVSLRDEEVMARLVFYRMSEEVESARSSYSGQTLRLSNYFANWPARMLVCDSGEVRERTEDLGKNG